MQPAQPWDRLGNGGLTFTEIGFGAMPIGNLYRAVSETEARAVLDAAWAGGIRVLLAGRYRLLEQGGLDFLNAAQESGVGVVIGGPCNSGVLASGARPGAMWNDHPAPAGVLAKVARLQAVCAAQGIRMLDAAFRFPLLHPAVVSVIPGGQSLAEMQSNLAAARAAVPGELWPALKRQGLMHPDAPVGGGRGGGFPPPHPRGVFREKQARGVTPAGHAPSGG